MKWLPLLLLALPAQADELTCGTRDDLAERLKTQWGEVSIFKGLTFDEKAVLEIFASQSGSWTALIVLPDGKACPFTSGNVYVATGMQQGA